MKIKSKLFILMAAIVCGFAMFTSCNENTPSRPGGGSDDDDDRGGGGGGGPTPALNLREMKVNVVGEDINKNAPYIRASVECCDWIILDVMHDGLTHENSRSFVCLSQKDQLGYYIYATPTTTVISEFGDGINKNLQTGDVVYLSTEGNYTRCSVIRSLCENPQIISDKLLPHQEEYRNPAGDTDNGGNSGDNGGNDNGGNQGGQGGSGGNGGQGGGIGSGGVGGGGIGGAPRRASTSRDRFGEEIYKNFSRQFRDGAEDIQEKTGWLGFKLSTTDALVSVLTSVGFSMSLKQITDYNPNIAEYVEDDINENNQFYIKMYLKSLPYVSFTSNVLAFIRDHSIIGKIWNNSGEIEETTDEDGDPYVSYPMFSSSRMMDERYYQAVTYIDNEKPEYAITLAKKGVEETSASFSVKIENIAGNMPYISSMKLIVEPVKEGSATEVDFYDMSAELTVSNLLPFTEYYAMVQINAAGRSYNSNIVKFTTTGAMEFFPSSLHFPAKGGSKGVAIKNLSYDQVESMTINAPSWCKIEKSASSFFVDVEASQQKRTGSIDVVVTLKDGNHTKLYGYVPVTQEDSENSWDGTKWSFKGNFTTSAHGIDPITGGGELVITVNSVERNDFSVTSADVKIIQNGTVSVNENDQLIINGTYTYDNMTIHISITCTRLSETTASASYTATLGEVTQTSSLDGTRIE